MADKVAAMTLMVQESPIHRLETLDSLLSTAKAGKHTAKMAIDSLKEVFSSRSGLPGDRRLVTLESRPPLPQSSERQVLWLFEEKLKQRYASFVNVVQGYLKHSASELRRFAAETCAHLLKSKPEQEAELLALLVNKLGDPDPSVSARASQLLSEVLKAHRAMTGVVVEEIQGFTARAPKGSVGAKARLAAVACLSQVYLSSELEPVATSLSVVSRVFVNVPGALRGVRGRRRPPDQTISGAVDRRRARVTLRPERCLGRLYLQRARCFVWTGPRGHRPSPRSRPTAPREIVVGGARPTITI